jgi:hypothetical protein
MCSKVEKWRGGDVEREMDRMEVVFVSVPVPAAGDSEMTWIPQQDSMQLTTA